MKTLLALVLMATVLTGCAVVPAYPGYGYYGPPAYVGFSYHYGYHHW